MNILAALVENDEQKGKDKETERGRGTDILSKLIWCILGH